MRFTCSVIIHRSRNVVVDLFQDPRYLEYWQDGFVSKEYHSGDPGRPGSKSLLTYKNRGRTLKLEETILINKLPDQLVGHYVAKPMTNTMKNEFSILGEHLTRWEAEVEYSEFRGLGPQFMAALFPGIFRKQVQKMNFNQG